MARKLLDESSARSVFFRGIDVQNGALRNFAEAFKRSRLLKDLHIHAES